MVFTKPFAELGREDASIAGGKGASLGEMIQNGIPVPNGFVVLADTFDIFLKETDLSQEIDALLHEVNHEAIHTVEAASEKIQGLIESQKMPENIQAEILSSFETLDARFVAVRSSATAEDGAEHAWAGQLDSYLNTSKENVLEKVQKCWASLFTPRAIFYRFEKGLHGTAISVAVVVQKMVESEVSGIAFSVHPVTEDYNQLIIEAGLGLGEAIVSGSVTPDSYVVEKNPRNILDINVSEQGRALYREGDAGGNVWRDLDENGAEQKLSKDQILELSEIILRIEKHYGFPCDIEWAFEKEKFYIVQSRPITTLTPQDPEKPSEDFSPSALKENSQQDSVSELEQDIKWKKIWSKRHSIRLSESWCFGAFNLAKHHGVAFPRQLIEIENGFGTGYVEEEGYQKMLKHFVDRIKDEGFEKVLGMAEAEYHTFLKFCKTLRSEKLKNLSDKELGGVFKEALTKEDHWMCFMWPVFALDEGLTPVFQDFLSQLSELEQERVMKLALTPEKQTAAAQYRTDVLRALSKEASEEKQEQLAQALAEKYSYFPVLNLDEELLAVDEVRQFIQKILQEVSDPALQLKKEKEEEHRCHQEFMTYISTLTKEEQNLLVAIKKIGYLREYRNDIRQEGYVFIKELYREIASRASLTLSQIIYCTRPEILDFLQTKKALPSPNVLEERFQYTQLYCDNQEVLYSYQKPLDREEIVNNDKEIKGIVAFKGKVTGKARVVLNVLKEGSAFEPGEILVTTTTNLAFVPIIGKAGAIITEEGGLLTHTAIVARELQKPCVIGTQNATKSIKTGDLVEVDADNGVVRILEAKEEGDLVKKYGLDTSTWTYKGFHGILHTFFPVMYTGPAMQDFFGDCAERMIFFVKEEYVHWYWNDEELTRIRNTFLERLKENNTYLEDLKSEWEKRIDSFENVLREIDATDLSTLADEKLASLYDKLYERYVHEFCCFMALGDAISMHADRYLVPEFQKVLGDDFTEVFPKLVTTRYLSFVEEESLARNELIANYQKKGSFEQKELDAHARRFFYIPNNYSKGIRLTGTDFGGLIKQQIEKDGETAVDMREERLKEKEKLIRKYKLSSWHQTLLYVMDEFFKIQDTRKKYALISNAYQLDFLKEAERRTGIPLQLLRYTVYPEFRDVLSKSISLDLLIDRQQGCVCLYVPGGYQIITGSQAEAALQFLRQERGEPVELKGMTASAGKAQGRVKKVLKIHDMINMEKGNILVSSMTRPEMVPVMKLASAIVTDEGGVTSHAAIISRELGIPCIIGTKVATQVLKDGDLVEVDADNGVVRILEK